jgi:peptidoglycan/LPS O-acetylase OafA/YrhL
MLPVLDRNAARWKVIRPEMAIMAQSDTPTLTARRIAGLDSLRFLCAIWVVLHHGARPDVPSWLGLSPIFEDLNAIAYDGVAAVIVFFVISGLCVHLPYARSERCEIVPFYAQRFTRIGVPLLVIIAFQRGALELGADRVEDDIAVAMRMVAWSLWCELIYYALYPGILICFRRIGFIPVIGIAFVAAYLLIIDHWQLLTYWQYSKGLAWLAALPAWLLGCALAQVLATRPIPVLPGSVWMWRIAAILLSIPPKALVYTSITPVLIGNPATLGLYALFAVIWVAKEIQHYQSHAPLALFEWGGRWSYSIYLVHNIVLVAFTHGLLHPFRFALWPPELVSVLALSYVFYRLVEYPSHRLARALGRCLTQWRAIDVLPISISRVREP